MKMKIAVTGGMGFIGHELVDLLITAGHEVTVVDDFRHLIGMYETTKLPIMKELYRILPNCHNVIEPSDFIEDSIFSSGDYDVVVHAGAVVDTKDLGSDKLFSTNITYTEKLTKLCSRYGAHLIFISSASVYGNDGFPNNPYGLTKAMGEKIVRRSKGDVAILRLFNVFGKFEHHKGEMASVLWRMSNALKTGSGFSLHSLDAKRDFVPSYSVVRAIQSVIKEMMGEGRFGKQEYDVGTGWALSFRELKNIVQEKSGVKGKYIVEAEIPPELIGRYQTNTCAGKNGVKNIGGVISTEEGIEINYGK